MKLNDLKCNGTYAAVRVLDPANKQIDEYVTLYGIPNNVLRERRRHATLLYSRTHCPLFVPDPKLVHVANPIRFEMFTTSAANGSKNCLVLLLSAPTLEARHRKLMSEHPATYDFPVYKPHITFSYDVGKMDVGSLPTFDEEILLGCEYSEDLIFDMDKK